MQPTPSFDTWTSGFLFAVAMGIFLFLILITNNNKRNYPIAFLVLAFSGILFSYVLFWTKYSFRFPYFNLLQFIGYYASGPLLYLYFVKLYNQEKPYSKFHLIPCWSWIMLTIIVNLQYLINYNLGLGTIIRHLTHYGFVISHMVIYFILCIRILYKHGSGQTEVKKIRYRWASVLLILYGLFVAAYISYYILVNFQFFNNQWDYMISITMSVAIYTIGYFVYKEPEIFNGNFFSELFLPIENKGHSFEEHLINELYHNLITYIETEKPFTDNELRLAQLADQVGYSTHLLSKVINKKSGKNFNNFINDYRLLEAEKLLKSSLEYSVKSIYFDVGFNNKVTFYKAFKQKHNCTPTEYKNANL